MKKKLCAAVLALALTVTLAGCGKEASAPHTPSPLPEETATGPAVPSQSIAAKPSPTQMATPTPKPTPSPTPTPTPTPSPIPTPTPTPTPSPTSAPCYAKVGEYVQDSEYGGTNNVSIKSVSADHTSVTLEGNWHRNFGFDAVAALDGNVATFDTGEHKGKIEFKPDYLLLTFSESTKAEHVGEPSRFDYMTEEELKQAHIDSLACALLNNDDWIHSPEYDPFEHTPLILRFSQDGTVTCQTYKFIGNPEGVIWDEDWEVEEYQLPYEVGYNRLTVDGKAYEMFIDMGATWHLYLTALGDDPLGLDGHYQLGDYSFV